MSGVAIIGVGQLRSNRERTLEGAVEPIDLIVEAIESAVADTGAGKALLDAVDALSVVQVISWSYDDLPGLLSARLALPATTATSTTGAGGHQPVAALAAAAERVTSGEARVAIVCGGEAQASLNAFRKAATEPPWSQWPGGPATFDREVGGTERMWDLGLVLPTRVYPMFENRLRYELGQTFDDAQQWSAEMYAGFSEIASRNPAAWNPDELTADAIRTVSPSNRMICFPYPLLMNATSAVDQAAAIIVADVTFAEQLGVPAEQMVHLVSAARSSDTHDILERPTFGSSVAMANALDTVLHRAGVEPSRLDALDLYSCFPIVPKLASLHLGKPQIPLSLTGGLTSFGGPHNNYSSHAIVAAAQSIRSTGGTGLVYGNGEYLTKHEAIVLSSTPPSSPYESVAATDGPSSPFLDGYTGPAEIETYTVEFSRDGRPDKGIVVGTNPDGVRVAARVGKAATSTMELLADTTTEAIGRHGTITEHDGRRSFAIDDIA